MEYPIEGVKVEQLEENESYNKFLSKQNAYKEGFIRLLPYDNAKRIHQTCEKDSRFRHSSG